MFEKLGILRGSSAKTPYVHKNKRATYSHLFREIHTPGWLALVVYST